MKWQRNVAYFVKIGPKLRRKSKHLGRRSRREFLITNKVCLVMLTLVVFEEECLVQQVEVADRGDEKEVAAYEEEFGPMVEYEESVASDLTKEEELGGTKPAKVEQDSCTSQPLKEDEVSTFEKRHTNEVSIAVTYVLVKSLEVGS